MGGKIKSTITARHGVMARERKREREKGLVKWFNSKQEALSSNRSMSTWLVGGAKFYVMCGFNSS
jgi:dihydrofolate reductase